MGNPMTSRKLGPGVYDVDGDMHLVMSELLADSGYEATPENIGRMERMAQECFAQLGIPVVVVDEGLTR
jgi:hypothetical protein